MTVTVALPKDVVLVEITTQIARVSHVLVVLLFDEGVHITLQIHFQYTEGLVTTFVELEGEGLSVLIPIGCTYLILTLEEVCALGVYGLFRFHINDDRNAVVERIARLGILQLGVDRLYLIGRRGLCICHIMLGCRLDEHSGIVLSILRPTSP